MGKAFWGLLLFFGTTAFAQTSKTLLVTHTLSGGMGGVKSQYFSGFATSLNYQLAVKRNIVVAGFQFLKEFAIFQGNLDHASELYLLYCYPLIQEKFALNVGAGISSVHNRIALYKILEREYGTDSYVEGVLNKTCFGVPLELQIASNKKKLNGGIKMHGNFNKINRFVSFSGFVSYSF